MCKESTDSKSDAKVSILSMGVYCVYRVTKMGEKVSIMSILSIVSRLLATDWQQQTSLERRLVDVNQDFILGSTVEPALITLTSKV